MRGGTRFRVEGVGVFVYGVCCRVWVSLHWGDRDHKMQITLPIDAVPPASEKGTP